MTTQPVNPKDTTPRSEPIADCAETPIWYLQAPELKLLEVLKILETADLGKLNKPLLWANAISAARVTIYRFMKQNDIQLYTEEQLRKTGNKWNRNHYETEKAALLEEVVKPFTSDNQTDKRGDPSVSTFAEQNEKGEQDAKSQPSDASRYKELIRQIRSLPSARCEVVHMGEVTYFMYVDSIYAMGPEDALKKMAHTDDSVPTAASTPTPSPSDPSLSQLRVENKKLREALKGLGAPYSGYGPCFCEMSIGHPLMNDHSKACKTAVAALASTKESAKAEDGK